MRDIFLFIWKGIKNLSDLSGGWELPQWKPATSTAWRSSERKKAKGTETSFGAERLEETCRGRSSDVSPRNLWVKERCPCPTITSTSSCLDQINFWFFLPLSKTKQRQDFCDNDMRPHAHFQLSTVPLQSICSTTGMFCLIFRWDLCWAGFSISNLEAQYQLLVQAPLTTKQKHQISQKNKDHPE